MIAKPGPAFLINLNAKNVLAKLFQKLHNQTSLI